MAKPRKFKERYRSYAKVFKQNWEMFKASRIGLVGIGIMIFFIIMALSAPYLGLRDPLLWFAPDEDIIAVDRYWRIDTTDNLYNGEDIPITQEITLRVRPKGTDARSDRVYVVTDDTVWTIRPMNGRHGWSFPSSFTADATITTPVVVINYGDHTEPDKADFVLLFGTESGRVYALNDTNKQSGSPVPAGANAFTSLSLDGSPVVSIAAYSQDISPGRQGSIRIEQDHDFDLDGVSAPFVVKGGFGPAAPYRAYYAGRLAWTWQILSAVSDDGLKFNKREGGITDNVRIRVDGTGPDATGAMDPFVFQGDDGQWNMYYAGRNGSASNVLHATSVDGLTWTKRGVVFSGSGGPNDSVALRDPRLVRDGGAWTLFYSGFDGLDWRILSATSMDEGANWTAVPGVRVEDARHPAVFQAPSGEWSMYYARNLTRTYVWDVATVAPGTEGTITLDLTMDPTLPPGSLVTNDLLIDYFNAAGEYAGRVESALRLDGAKPFIVAWQETNLAEAEANDALQVTLHYRNVGSENATNVWLNNTLHDNATAVNAVPLWDNISGDGKVLSWDLGAVPVGAAGIIVLNVTIDGDTPEGRIISNAFTVEYQNLGGASQSPVSEVRTLNGPKPNVVAWVAANRSTAAAGDAVRFTITYRNAGTENATGVQFMDGTQTNSLVDGLTPLASDLQGRTRLLMSNATANLTTWAQGTPLVDAGETLGIQDTGGTFVPFTPAAQVVTSVSRPAVLDLGDESYRLYYAAEYFDPTASITGDTVSVIVSAASQDTRAWVREHRDVYVATTANGTVYAFSAVDNGILWSIHLADVPARVSGTPLIPSNDPTYSQAFNAPGSVVVVGTQDGQMHGLRVRDGGPAWEAPFDLEIPEGASWFSPPVVAQPAAVPVGDGDVFTDVAYAASGDGWVYAVFAQNGTIIPQWKDLGNERKGVLILTPTGDMDGGNLSAPMAIGEIIYVGSSTGRAYALYRNTAGTIDAGVAKWVYEDPALADFNATMAVRPTHLKSLKLIFFAANHDNGTAGDPSDDRSIFYGLAEDGNFSWKQNIDGHIAGSPIVWRSEEPVAGTQGQLQPAVWFGTDKGIVFAYSASGIMIAPLEPTWITPVPSGNDYWLGTDSQGRDLFSQLIWGSQIALMVGFLAAFFSISIGVVIGLVAGYTGGRVDTVLMRFTDVILVLPGLPLVIILAAVLGANIWNIILVIAIVGWPGVARVIRSEVLSLKERPFIDSARVTGASNVRIMFKHVAPNILPLAFLYMTFAVSGAILTEAALSFIGLGDVTTASWGQMLEGIQRFNVLGAWWWLWPPGLGITLLSLAFYLVGRGYEQIVNPRLRRR